MCLAQTAAKIRPSRADDCIPTEKSRAQGSSSYKTARQTTSMRSLRKKAPFLPQTLLHPQPCSQSLSTCTAFSRSQQLSRLTERRSSDHCCCGRTKMNIKETLRQRQPESPYMLIRNKRVTTGELRQRTETSHSASRLVRALHHS